MKNKISVIIPVYNEEKYISECLSSLTAQTYKPLEIIIIDDGSTDESISIIKYQISKLKLKIIKLYYQIHKGPGLARNLGAKKAIGEILVFVDGDMKFDKNYLKKLVDPIIRNKAVATFTKEEYVANADNVWSRCWNINNNWPTRLHIDPAIGKYANNFRAIKKEIFLKTRGFLNVGYGEDTTVLSQLNQVKAKVAPGAVCYHFNPSSLTEVFISARWMGRGEGFYLNLKYILTFCFPNSLRKGILIAYRKNMPLIVIFKIVFDCAILTGIIERLITRNHYK